jgi:hypothetical protein
VRREACSNQCIFDEKRLSAYIVQKKGGMTASVPRALTEYSHRESRNLRRRRILQEEQLWMPNPFGFFLGAFTLDSFPAHLKCDLPDFGKDGEDPEPVALNRRMGATPEEEHGREDKPERGKDPADE